MAAGKAWVMVVPLRVQFREGARGSGTPFSDAVIGESLATMSHLKFLDLDLMFKAAVSCVS